MTSCPICLEEFLQDKLGEAETTVPPPNVITLSSCQHTFCEPCLQSHLVETVQSRRSSVIKCPFLTSCGESINGDQVQELLSRQPDAKIPQLFERLEFISENPDWLECPSCDSFVPPKPLSPETPNDVRCPQCQLEFCRLHGQAHQGRKCYEHIHDSAMVASENLLNDRTVPCSHCGARLQRSRGCSYVVCSACHNDMCYDCKTHIYLSEGRLRYCTKCSTALAGHGQASCGMNCLLFIFLLLVMFLWVFLASFLAVVTLGCCAGYCCGRGLKYHDEGTQYAPKRGWLAVLVTIFLPCLSSLESEEFVDRHVPFFLADLVADEIPVMGAAAPQTEEFPNTDVELGEVSA